MRLLRFLSHLRLTILLFFILAFLCALGTLIPQGQPYEFYLDKYSKPLAPIFKWLGVINLYHTPYFLILLGLLAINLFLCQIIRMGRIKNLKLKRKNLSLLGIHTSALLIMLGSLISLLYGEHKELELKEKRRVSILAQEKVSLELEKFDVQYYALSSGQAKSFKAKIALWEDRHKLKSQAIEVNHPLHFKGLRLYLSSFRHIPELKLRMSDENKEKTFYEGIVSLGEVLGIPQTRISLSFVDFEPDFAIDYKGKVRSRTQALNNPAAKFEVYRGKKLLGSTWVFYNSAIAHREPKIEDYTFQIEEILPCYAVSFELVKDPGIPFVWAGFLLIALSLPLRYVLPNKP